MNLIVGLIFIAIVMVTVKPFDLLIFDSKNLESSPIQAQVFKEEPDEIPQPAKTEDITPETVEENMTEMGLGMGFDGAGASFSGLGGGGSVAGAGGSVVKSARVLKRAEPVYPERAKAAQITGSVTLKIHISESGEVLHCLVMSSEPSGVFDASAISAVEKWKFEPAVKNGQKVSSYMVQKLSFRMEN